MNDVVAQYKRYQLEIDEAIFKVIRSGNYINGNAVKEFETQLSKYLEGAYVITCANGTDALQIALMALELNPGDEVITTPFTFAATAEVVKLLGLEIVYADINPNTLNIDSQKIEGLITSKTKAIIPVHLFGQCADMSSIMEIANRYGLFVIEDAAQSLGTKYFLNKEWQPSGTIGHIGATSFFPSKNLGAYGDGGALFTRDSILAEKLRMIKNHGAKKKYYHEIVGVNSRLDDIQAAVLNVKLKYLDADIHKRQAIAAYYDELLVNKVNIVLPQKDPKSTHSYHQYTVRVKGDRDLVMARLKENNISSAIYYPLSLHHQKPYLMKDSSINFPVTENACDEVLSLPIFPDLKLDEVVQICSIL